MMVIGDMVAALDGEIEPLFGTKRNAIALSAFGFSSTVTVKTHSVGPPVTPYVTPGSTGKGDPPLKSAAVTPLTGELNVAVTGMTVLSVEPTVAAPASTDDVSVGCGGV